MKNILSFMHLSFIVFIAVNNRSTKNFRGKKQVDKIGYSNLEQIIVEQKKWIFRVKLRSYITGLPIYSTLQKQMRCSIAHIFKTGKSKQN